MVDDTGELKLIDFGFAIKIEDPRKNVFNFCGTTVYMSPEIFQRKAYDPFKADVWALGVLLYKVVTGVYPFEYNDNASFMKLLSEGQVNYRLIKDWKLKRLLEEMLEVNELNRINIDGVLRHEWLRRN